ncbi:metallophosphoesterase [Undibacterium arcticum]|uniref:Metallophosphoesterase n=1 Tax=Undibacterium arcticum TaxID=1762892 RepID=A0ABV7EWU0_9BURK
MKIQIASDLHLEFLMQSHADYRIIDKTDADVLVLAGDIHNRTKAIEAFRDWPVPVVYVHGNHEFYGQNLLKVQDALRVTAAGTNVHYLENDEYVLNGVRFLGCCLWTDYELTGDRPGAMFEARYGMRDHEVIRVADGKRFMPSHALALHKQSRKWLAQKLDEPFPGQTVVVTHHGPHPASIDEKFAGNPANPAFYSDLTPLMGKAALWIHGHSHASSRYNVAGTTVIANPCGYPENKRFKDPQYVTFENADFDRALVFDLPLV